MILLRLRRSLISLCDRNLGPRLLKPYLISEPVLFFSTSETKKPQSPVSVSDFLTNRHDFSPETALKVSSYRSHVKDPEKADSVISLLKDVGFSRTDSDTALQRSPCLLFSSVENIRPKIKIFRDAGICSSDIVHMISSEPWILSRGADRLSSSIVALKSVIGSIYEVSRILRLCGWFLRIDLEKTLIPNIELLKSHGVPEEQIVRYLPVFPRMFLVKHERLKGFIDVVEEMRVDRGSLVFLLAIRAVSSMSPETWKLKLGAFRSLGFSEEDIVAVFRKVPLVFTISEKKLMEVAAVLIETGEADMAYLVRRPEMLMLSAERRLRPRLRVLKILESKNLLKKKPTLTSACKMSEKMFLSKYVVPHIDVVGDAYSCTS